MAARLLPRRWQEAAGPAHPGLERDRTAAHAGRSVEAFGEAAREWFRETFDAPTRVQEEGWKRIASGRHSLLIAPTGSGKTLAAFLYALDRLSLEPAGGADGEGERGVRVLYVSPLKALVYDIERNLRAPLVGMRRTAERLGVATRALRVDVRTGDTIARDRRRQLKDPAEILVTTPESLYLLLGSQARETLRTVEHVIVDEVHALAPTKRGAHLALSLERLSALTARDPQRIGLSATAKPLEEIARFLGGDRPVDVVDTSEPPRIDLRIVVPVDDMTRPELEEPAAEVGAMIEPGGEAPHRDGADRHGMWPVIYPELVRLIREHRTTIVFVNSRGLCERLSQHLNELAEQNDEAMPFVRGHHGSISHENRRQIEEDLKEGRLEAIVATSSLELGIDMGAVDLVVMVESPGAASRGLQRIGRAGHQVGEVSIGRLFPKHRGDLLEAAVVAEKMMAGDIEPLRIPKNPLDVLAQQIVAMTTVDPWTVDDVAALAARTASFRELPASALRAVLDMLSGHYPSHELADLRPRIVWDREKDELTARRGSKQIALVNGGTIPDRGLYAVTLGEDGPRLGELDEEMVYETTAGETFMLGASTWRVREITRDRVIVDPAPGEPGKLPFWKGDGPGRPIELGYAVGAFVREISAMSRDEAVERLVERNRLDARAAKNLLGYLGEQREATGTLPTDRAITVERFRDELGDWRVCILSPFGARVHAPWALALKERLSARAGFDVQAMWSDDGIVLTVADSDEPPELDLFVLDADELEETVVSQLAKSAVFASQFRENAARALLLPRRKPGSRTPLWAQRLRAQRLLGAAQQYPSFPIVMETYRACMQDVFDLPALEAILGAITRREIRIDEVETESASPFARSLVFAYVAAYLYEGDSPLAERRAQALSLDREMLRELLGREELRELLDAGVIDELEDELQHLADDRRARHPDALHDVLRRVGDLDEDELRARSDADPMPWLDELRRSRRAVKMRVGGRDAWVAAEDVGLYRDALGASPPAGVPSAFLEARPRAVEEVFARYARTHGPFRQVDVAARFRLPAAQVEMVLRALEATGAVLHGDFRPGGREREWCDVEVLRRIKRRTLAKLRNEVAPVERIALARFLPSWHGVGGAAIGGARLEEAIERLEGLPLSFAELERAILPARVRGFASRMLDELGAMGWLVWIGHGSLGADDGRIALYRRDRVARLVEPPSAPDTLDERHLRILDHLDKRGASFFSELEAASGAHRTEALEALWDLVWAGLVTNDTFQALRALRMRRKKAPSRRRSADTTAAGGRWSLVAGLLAGAPAATERAHARAVTLLDRHGVVSREHAAIEAHGGFGATYRVLRAMEEAGKVRRGYFVEGLSGAQFAYAGAVDRLRGMRIAPDAPEVRVLAAIDPANAWGWLLPWPDTTDPSGAPPRRAAGATVVLVDGEPVLFLDRGGRRLRTFAGRAAPELLSLAARALEQLLRTGPKLLRIEHIDGTPARTSPHAPLLRASGFGADHRGLLLERARLGTVD